MDTWINPKDVGKIKFDVKGEKTKQAKGVFSQLSLTYDFNGVGVIRVDADFPRSRHVISADFQTAEIPCSRDRCQGSICLNGILRNTWHGGGNVL